MISFSKPSSLAILRQRTTVNRSLTCCGIGPKRSVSISAKAVRSSSVSRSSSCVYKERRSVILDTYSSGIRISRSVSIVQSVTNSFLRSSSAANTSLKSLDFSSCMASARIFWYISKPISAINPLCSPPSILPAPRISRSRIAIWNPLPSSLNCSSICNLLRLSSGRVSRDGATR
ncbi:hypothetical protein D3C87_1639200 [compost metagenome]